MTPPTTHNPENVPQSAVPSAAACIFRLDTSYGGGKTHGLIALTHAAAVVLAGTTNGVHVTIHQALVAAGSETALIEWAARSGVTVTQGKCENRAGWWITRKEQL